MYVSAIFLPGLAYYLTVTDLCKVIGVRRICIIIIIFNILGVILASNAVMYFPFNNVELIVYRCYLPFSKYPTVMILNPDIAVGMFLCNLYGTLCNLVAFLVIINKAPHAFYSLEMLRRNNIFACFGSYTFFIWGNFIVKEHMEFEYLLKWMIITR